MVYFRLKNANEDELCEYLKQRKVMVLPLGLWIRAVVHQNVTDEHIKLAVDAIKEA